MALVILNRSKQTFGRVLNRLTKTRRVEEPFFPLALRSPELYRGNESSRKKSCDREGERENERERRAVERISRKRETCVALKNAFLAIFGIIVTFPRAYF